MISKFKKSPILILFSLIIFLQNFTLRSTYLLKKNCCKINSFVVGHTNVSDTICWNPPNFKILWKDRGYRESFHNYILIVWDNKIIDAESFNFTVFEPFLTMSFKNILGFHLNSTFELPPVDPNYMYPYPLDFFGGGRYFRISFYYTKFDFYLKKKRINSCSDLLKANVTHPKTFIHAKSDDPNSFYHLSFYNTYFRQTTCPLFFKGVLIKHLVLNALVNSFYKKNTLTFRSDVKLDSFKESTKVIWVSFMDAENIHVDETLLHPDIFSKVCKIDFDGMLKSIANDIFRPMKQLQLIIFDLSQIEVLLHKGIKWISSINYDVNVNMSDKLDLKQNMHRFVLIYQDILLNADAKKNQANLLYKYDTRLLWSTITDEDFCLFKDFPFQQLILIALYDYFKYFKDISCTKIWLAKYADQLLDLDEATIKSFKLLEYNPYRRAIPFLRDISWLNNKSKIHCDFEKKLAYCNKTSFHLRSSWYIVDYRLFFLFIEFVLLILIIGMSLFGLMSNLFVIYTINIKDNNKHLGAKQYAYMRLVSAFNIVILVINILSPIYQCQPHQGIYCSPIKERKTVNFFQIINDQVLMTFFRFMSNFSYVGFSICRLSLIGTEHSKFVKEFPNYSQFVTMFISFILSGILSTIKIFVYQVDEQLIYQEFKKENMPIRFDRNEPNIDYSNSTYKTKAILINSFNIVSDLTNYFVFTVIFLALDIALMVKLKKTLNTKMNKKKNENNSVIKRTIMSVVFYALFSIFLKLPASFKSFLDVLQFDNDYRLAIANNKMNIFYDRICITEHVCETFQKFASFLFTISISWSILFYYIFDKKFLIGFKIAFSRIFSNKETHEDFVRALENPKHKHRKQNNQA